MLFWWVFLLDEDIKELVDGWDLNDKVHGGENKLFHLEELSQIVKSITGIGESTSFWIYDFVEFGSHEEASDPQKLEVSLIDWGWLVDEDTIDELNCDVECLWFEF